MQNYSSVLSRTVNISALWRQNTVLLLPKVPKCMSYAACDSSTLRFELLDNRSWILNNNVCKLLACWVGV